MQQKTGKVLEIKDSYAGSYGKKAKTLKVELDNSDEQIIVRFTPQNYELANGVKEGDHIMIWYVYRANTSSKGVDYNNLYGRKVEVLQFD